MRTDDNRSVTEPTRRATGSSCSPASSCIGLNATFTLVPRRVIVVANRGGESRAGDCIRHRHRVERVPRQPDRDARTCRGPRTPPRRSGTGRTAARKRTPRRARQAAAARPGDDSARSRRAVPRTLGPRRRRHVRRRHSRRRHHHRHRPRLGPRMRHRVQRLHHQGRHLFPDDGEEAFARAGDRAGKPAAVHLPGRFRRRQPAAPDRGVSRPRAFRPHLLQPGDAVGRRHSAGRGGDGLVHRGRRLCAGDVGRDHHRERAGHHLPRRPAAGEGRDRRGGDGRGSGRGGRPREKVRRRRSHGRERPSRAVDRAPHRRQPQHASGPRRRAGKAARAEIRRRRTRRHRARRSQEAIRRARGDRAPRRRLPSSTSSRRSTAPRWSPASPTSTASRSASSATTAFCFRRAR